MSFRDSYIGQLRQLVGTRLLLVPGVRAVFVRADGKVLLEQRRDFGAWGVPSGSVEIGETQIEALRREMREELGVEVSDATAFGSASDPRHETITFPNGDRCQFISLLVLVERWDGVPRPHGGEALGIEWCDPGALPARMLPNMRRTVEAFLRHRHTGAFQLI